MISETGLVDDDTRWSIGTLGLVDRIKSRRKSFHMSLDKRNYSRLRFFWQIVKIDFGNLHHPHLRGLIWLRSSFMSKLWNVICSNQNFSLRVQIQLLENGQNGEKWSKRSKWSKMVQNGSKWSKMVQHGEKLSKLVRNGEKCSNWSKWSKWPKMVKIAKKWSKWSKIIQNGSKWS